MYHRFGYRAIPSCFITLWQLPGVRTTSYLSSTFERRHMAKQRRYTALEIAAKLKEASGLAKEGKPQSDIAKSLGISVMTFHRWRKAHENPPQDEENRLPPISNYANSSLS